MWVAVALASLIGLLVLLASIPVDLALSVDRQGKPVFRVRVSWLFGLFRRDIAGAVRKQGKVRTKARRGLRSQLNQAREMLRLLRTPRLFRQVMLLLRRLLRRLEVREFSAEFRIGLGDPADTAVLFAFVGPAVFLVNRTLHRDIRVAPSFGSEAVFEGHSRGVLRVQPIRLFIPSLQFVFSPAGRKTLRQVIRWRRGK